MIKICLIRLRWKFVDWLPTFIITRNENCFLHLHYSNCHRLVSKLLIVININSTLIEQLTFKTDRLSSLSDDKGTGVITFVRPGTDRASLIFWFHTNFGDFFSTLLFCCSMVRVQKLWTNNYYRYPVIKIFWGIIIRRRSYCNCTYNVYVYNDDKQTF